MRQLGFIGAVSGGTAVVFGAFGAHLLVDRLSTRGLEVFELASRYQLVHALAIVATALVAARVENPSANRAGWCFVLGSLVFCGSLYALSLSGVGFFGAITPIGGVLLILGWGFLAHAFLARKDPMRTEGSRVS